MNSVQPQSWEQVLLRRAYEAWPPTVKHQGELFGGPILEQAYARCAAITAANSRSFYLASLLLPSLKRRGVRALYAFCRTSDDLVDCRDPGCPARLEEWRGRALSDSPPTDDLVAIAWADTRLRFHIPSCYAEQLLDGVALDLNPHHYRTFSELAGYAYGVASTVGLMSMHIIGFTGPAALPYAVKLGVALQMTNILRDVGEDLQAGRVYLPVAELQAFGLAVDDLRSGQVDDRWRDFMRFQIDRNRSLYAEAWPGIGYLHRDGRAAVAAAGALYREILTDIEAHDYDVFTRRARSRASARLRLLAAAWRDWNSV